MKHRAETPEAKRGVVERILAAWDRLPMLRLGQLLSNAVDPSDVFYAEDEILAESVEAFAYVRGAEPKKEPKK